jgi:hypothetical protein
MKTTFSRRELYALGEPIGDSATIKKVGGGRIYGMGGGGNTTSTGTTYTSNIPEYAKPYVETMLGATQKQLFTGNDTEDGGYNITGFKPYTPYSTNASDYIAGFSPLQQQAQKTVGGMQVPGQFGTASDITGRGIMGAAQVGQQAGSLYGLGNAAASAGNQYAQQATDPNAISAYMSPYMQNVLQGQMSEAVRQSEMQKMGNQAQAVQAGAYGGSRQALVESERQRNLGTQLGGIQAQGLQNAFQNAQQAQQYGAGLNLQGLQAGAGMYGQGIGAQQAAIGQMMQGAGQYAGLGAQQLQAEQGIANLQSQFGAQMQSQEQQKINQAIQDYANAQQYPLMQLGTMSNMLRGLPMQAQTTQQYVAAPNALTQGIGTAGAAASIYNATKAEGGVIKSMAQGGITSVPSYDVGGEVKGQLADMSIEELEKQANGSPSRTVREMAKELLREKQMARVPQGASPVGPMGVDYQAPQLAGGGIIAFAQPEEENNYSLVKDSFMDRINAAAARPLSTRLSDNSGAPPVTTEDAGGAPPPRKYNDLPEIAAMQAEADKQSALAGRDTAEIVKEIKAQAGPNVGAQEQRAKIMSERANLADEAQRQRHMRLAQFFARWGSTSGPVLVAGMNALNEKLPDMIEDQRVFRKAKLELDKTVYDLDQATRLEDKGDLKEARALKEKAAERAMHLNQYIGNNATQLKREEMGNAARIRGEEIQARARSGDRAYQYDSLNFNKAITADSVAQQKLATAIGDVEKAKAGDKPYERAQRTINEYNAMIDRNKDKKNYKPDPQITADAQAAEKLVQQRESAYEEKLKIVRAEAEKARLRLSRMTDPTDKDKDKEKVKGANKPTVSNWK